MVQCKEVARLMLLLHHLLFLLSPLDPLLFLSYFSRTHSSSLSFLSSLAERHQEPSKKKSCSIYINYTLKVNIALNVLCAHSFPYILLLVACPLLGTCSSRPRSLPQQAWLSSNYSPTIQLHSSQVKILFGQQCQAKCIFFSLSFCLL